MTVRKLDKLKEIKESTGPRELLTYIHRLGRLEEQYRKLSGASFYPKDNHESVQEWR